MDEIWENGRTVVRQSVELAKLGQEQEALNILDNVLRDAVDEGRDTWVSILCGHAAIIADHMGDRTRQLHYQEIALPFARDYRFAAYNFAQQLLSDGQLDRAERYAVEAYELCASSEAQADRDLAEAILRQWPNAVKNR